MIAIYNYLLFHRWLQFFLFIWRAWHFYGRKTTHFILCCWDKGCGSCGSHMPAVSLALFKYPFLWRPWHMPSWDSFTMWNKPMLATERMKTGAKICLFWRNVPVFGTRLLSIQRHIERGQPTRRDLRLSKMSHPPETVRMCWMKPFWIKKRPDSSWSHWNPNMTAIPRKNRRAASTSKLSSWPAWSLFSTNNCWCCVWHSYQLRFICATDCWRCSDSRKLHWNISKSSSHAFRYN